MSSQQLTESIPVVNPIDARRGRFLVGRRRWVEVVAYAARLDNEMRQRNVSLKSWEVVATYVTARHEWQLFVREVRKEKAS